MHAPGIWTIVLIAVVVILLFGRGKISGLLGEVAAGIKTFQKISQDEALIAPSAGSDTTSDQSKTEA